MIDFFFPFWNVTVMCYNLVFYCRESRLGNFNLCFCGVSTHQQRNTRLTAVRNIGVSTLEDGRDTGLTPLGNNGVSTMEDGTDAELTAVRNNGMSSQEDGRDTELTSVACLPWRMVHLPSSRR